MAEKLGLRLRFALFFAVLALGGIAAFAAGLWLGHARAGGAASGYVIAGLAGGFGLLGLAVWIALLFDENVARPILGLAAGLQTRARTRVTAAIDAAPARYLGALAPAAQAIHGALEDARRSQEAAIAEKTAHVARDKALFEALVRDLAEGVVVLAPDGRILLYNRAAARMLGGLGLGRALAGFLRIAPVEDAIARLARRGAAEAGQGAAGFLAASADGSRILTGAATPIAADEEAGHVLLFRDATAELRSHARLEALLAETIEGARRPAAAMSAVLDVLQGEEGLSQRDRARFDAALREELARLSGVLAEAASDLSQTAASHWPVRSVAVQDIFAALSARMGAGLATVPSAARVRCDGYAVTEILAKAAAAVTADRARRSLSLSAREQAGEVRLELGWTGPPLAQGDLDSRLQEPLSAAYGGYTGLDALAVHRTALWAEAETDAEAGGGRAVLILPAAGPDEAAPDVGRPEYDFRLPAAPGGSLENRPLSGLDYVVFDTETTGLDPECDEVVQIAAVRIVGGRLLRGEVFDRLVDPQRPIPAQATAIHGLTSEMVAGAGSFAEAGQAFTGFAGGAVLVAHNASFDMAFLKRLEARGGAGFPMPVLCTARLSLSLFPHEGDHTLDALAARLGVHIPASLRHTARGDAVATAEVFLHLLPLLEARGCSDLAGAMRLQGGQG